MKLSNYLQSRNGKILTVAGFIESKTHVLLVQLNKQEKERAEYSGRERDRETGKAAATDALRFRSLCSRKMCSTQYFVYNFEGGRAHL